MTVQAQCGCRSAGTRGGRLSSIRTPANQVTLPTRAAITRIGSALATGWMLGAGVVALVTRMRLRFDVALGVEGFLDEIERTDLHRLGRLGQGRIA